MNTELGTIVKNRREMLGLSRLSVAKDIGTTPNMLANFEENQSTLKPEVLANCLKRLGIDVSSYDKRANLAKYAAHKLMSKGISVERLMTMSKYELADITQLPEIRCLLDMTQEDQENILDLQESGLVNFEGTFIHFRSLLAYLMNAGDNPNSPQAQRGRDITFKAVQNLAQEKNPDNTKQLVESIELQSIAEDSPITDNKKNQKPQRTGADGLFSDSVGKTLFGISLLALAVGGIAYTLSGRKK